MGLWLHFRCFLTFFVVLMGFGLLFTGQTFIGAIVGAIGLAFLLELWIVIRSVL